MAKKDEADVLKNKLRRGTRDFTKGLAEDEKGDLSVKDKGVSAVDAKYALKNIEPEDLSAQDKSNQQLALVAKLDAEIEESNKQVYNDLIDEYFKIVDRFDSSSEIDQVKILSRYHQFEKFTGWMIGDLLMKKKEFIEKSRGASGYNSIYDFINQNEEYLGFGKSAAQRYMVAREGVTIKQFQRLGIRKAVVLSSIPDPIKREEIIDQVISKPKTTEAEVKLMVAEFKESEQKEKQAEKAKVQKAINKIVGCNVIEKKDHVRVEPNDQGYTSYFYIAIMKYLPQIKAEAKRLVDKADAGD